MFMLALKEHVTTPDEIADACAGACGAFDRILALAWERSISITTPQMGEAFNISQPQRGNAWWLGVEGESEGVVQNA